MEEFLGIGALFKLIEEHFGKRTAKFTLGLVVFTVIAFCLWWLYGNVANPIWDEGSERGWWDGWPREFTLALRLLAVIAGLVLIVIAGLMIGAALGTAMNKFLPPPLRKTYHQQVAHSLALLRSLGVEIRNRGMRLTKQHEVTDWIPETVQWEADVKAEIAKVDKADSELFETLNWVSTKDFPSVNAQHLTSLRNHDERISRLEKLLETWRERGLR